MDYFKKIKEHWLVSSVILCGVVWGMIWTLSDHRMVEPSNSEIEKLSSQSTGILKTENKPNNEKKSLMAGTAFTSKFGFIVYISGSDNDLKHANIYITLKNQKNKNHNNVGVGERIKINHEDNSYSIEINNIRGDWVDLTIHKNA